MAHLLLGRCQVSLAHMQEFTTRIQRWEQDVMGTPHAPAFHGVFLEHDDPATVVIELRFDDRSTADRCIGAGHVAALRREVLACTSQDPGDFTRYDLFYGASEDGRRFVFGEPASLDAAD
jgi:hypothetical protein